MKKRFTFKCWNCSKTYTIFREMTKGQEVIVACPFCRAEAAVDLSPYPFKKIVLRDERNTEQEVEELDLPDVLPTQPRTATRAATFISHDQEAA